MKVEIIHDVQVSINTNDQQQRTCAYPLTTLAQDGSIVCVYRCGKEKHSYDGTWLCQRSTDQGRSWSPSVTIFDGLDMTPPQSTVCGGICTANNGVLFSVFNAVEVTKPDAYFYSEEGETQSKCTYIARSSDNGATWDCKSEIDLPGFLYDFTSNPLVLPDGHIFIPGERRRSGECIRIFATHSDDHGQTFEPFNDCIVDPEGKLHLCDSRYDVFPDGEIVAYLWALRMEDDETLQTHRAVSADQGRTWSTALPVGYLGQIVHPLVLDDNTVLAASNYRWDPHGIYLWLSPDRGLTWPAKSAVRMWDPDRNQLVAEPAELTEDQIKDLDVNIWKALALFNFGTPDLTALPDGTILLTYYAKLNGHTHVRACRFKANVSSR